MKSPRARKALRLATQIVAVGYPLALAAVAGVLHWVGEGWWVSDAGLYLPRVVFALPLPFLAVALRIFEMRRLFWCQAASALLLLFPLMGFVVPWPVSRDREAPTVRVLSFNVNGGAGGVEAVADEVERYAPDIVLLEETTGLDDLSRVLKSRYETVEAVGQFTLATRFTVSSIEKPSPLSYYGRSRSARFLRYVLETPLGRMVVYHVHPLSPREGFYGLRGPRGLRREIVNGGLLRGEGSGTLQMNAGLRTLQVETFSAAASKETDPVLIAGDTNLPGLSPVFRRYLSAYADGFTRAGWGFGYTFPTNKKGWFPWMRIDRILANDAFRFVHFEVGRSKVSDHLCVVADLQRKPQ